MTTAVFIVSALLALPCAATESMDRTIQFGGRAAVESGQMVMGHFHSKPIPWRIWMNRGYLNFRLHATLGENVRIAAEPEVRIWFNNYPLHTDYVGGDHTGLPFRQFSTVSIAEAQGMYRFFGNDDERLVFAGGVFPVKYNPDVMNLGEYLFRSGAYVPYLQTAFEYQFARLSGLHLVSDIPVLSDAISFRQEMMLYTETNVQPLHDWSLAYLANANLSVVEVGGGVCLHRWFPVAHELTSPENPTNLYFNETGDSSYFTFTGIKLMGRAAIDPKPLLPSSVSGLCGKKDFRLYAEFAILGLTDYPAYMPQVNGSDTSWVLDTARNFYGNLHERIPVMAGFTFPACGLFDYLSLEIESYRWPEKNVYFEQSFQSENPRPPAITAVSRYTKTDYAYGQWKWSLNAKKTVVSGFSLIGQVARDHMRYDIYYEKNRDEEDAFTRSREWYWMLRVNYAF